MAIDEAVLGKRVGIDTSVLIGAADPADAHHRVSIDLINTVLTSGRTLVVPAIAYGEFIGGGPDDQEDFGRSSGIEVVAFDDQAARMMKSIDGSRWKTLPQGRHVVKVDALIAVTAKRHNVSLFVTNDRNQVGLSREIGLNVRLAQDLQTGQQSLFPTPPPEE